jgi:hypothetical protein
VFKPEKYLSIFTGEDVCAYARKMLKHFLRESIAVFK